MLGFTPSIPHGSSQNIPTSDHESIEDKTPRLNWNIGSVLEIYSRSEKQWFAGQIIHIFVDDKGEWLRIQYANKSKLVQRFCPGIRPMCIQINTELIGHNSSFDSPSSPSAASSSISSIPSSYIDENGFVLSLEEKKEKMKEIGTSSHRNSIRKRNKQMSEWLQVLNEWDTYMTSKPVKLQRKIRSGVPSALRALVWKKLLGLSEISMEQKQFYFKIRFKAPMNEYKAAIDRDLNRTFPRHTLFNKHRGKESLRNVLYALANHDLHLGYTQGMGYIAALFLMLMTEEEVFWCLSALFDENASPLFAMRGLYLDGLPLLNIRFTQFDEVFKTMMPQLYRHIAVRFEINPALYAHRWFVTNLCCIDDFKAFEFVYRIWDVYLFEGIEFIFRVCFAMMKLNEAQLLKIDKFDELMIYLQALYSSCDDVDLVLKKAFQLKLNKKHLQIIRWNVHYRYTDVDMDRM